MCVLFFAALCHAAAGQNGEAANGDRLTDSVSEQAAAGTGADAAGRQEAAGAAGQSGEAANGDRLTDSVSEQAAAGTGADAAGRQEVAGAAGQVAGTAGGHDATGGRKSAPGPGQNGGAVHGIMVITGAESEEALSEQVLERFEVLARRPLRINMMDMRELSSCGLFSLYQTATLLDYRSTHGDILSLQELAAVDGFGSELAGALAPYIAFDSALLPGQKDRSPISLSAEAVTSVKNGLTSIKGKYLLEGGDSFSAFAAFKGESYSFHAAGSGRKHLRKVIAGDFNARFGQGLTMWNGFSLSGMSSPSSLYRRATMLRPSTSWTDTGLRGAAAELAFGSVSVSTFVSLPALREYMEGKGAFREEFLPGANVTLFLRNGQLSVTGVGEIGSAGDGNGSAGDGGKTGSAGNNNSAGRKDGTLRAGLDGRLCIRGIDIFGEVAADLRSKSIAAVGGAVFPIGECSIGAAGRYYPQSYSSTLLGAVRSGSKVADEAGGTLSFQRKTLVLCADWYRKLSTSRDQLKLSATGDFALGKSLTLRPKAAARLRTGDDPARIDCRSDVIYKHGFWTGTARLNWLRCERDAFLGYLEGGYVSDRFKVHARGTIFRIDKWNDRIYAYERGVPGSFSIPAYYGRGWGLNITAGWKPSLGRARLRLYASGNLVTYPWLSPGQTSPKPSRLSLSLSAALSL